MHRLRYLYILLALLLVLGIAILSVALKGRPFLHQAADPPGMGAAPSLPMAAEEPYQRRYEDQTGTVTYPFTYRTSSGPSADDSPQEGQLLFPERLRLKEEARVHLFLFLSGDGSGSENQESAAVPYLRNALEEVAATKDIVILTTESGRDEVVIDDLYAAGMDALRSILPLVAVEDIVIGGNGGTDCGRPKSLLAALAAPPLDTRSVVFYDGCLGDGVTPETAHNPEGLTLYFNPDGSGMGNEDPVSVPGNERRREVVRRLWQFGQAPKPCPPCAASLAPNARCFGQTNDFKRRDGGELLSVETNDGHLRSVETMTNIAFCAFYR